VLCKTIQPRSLDLLCFPEMAFTGYVFDNATEISPYLEQPRTGPTSLFCSEIARTLECYVFAGYPEVLSSGEPSNSKTTTESMNTSCDSNRAEEVGANSAVVYDPKGEWVGGYRKTHLFETDKTWAKAGTGFATFILPPPLRTVCLGICMDLNPQIEDWTSLRSPYEIAGHCLSNKANVLVLLNAWLDSTEDQKKAHDLSTLNYWSARLRPLWANEDVNEKSDDTLSPSNNSEHGRQKTIVVICNRSGKENGKTFAGTSAIFSMVTGSGRPNLLAKMERKEEGVRILDIKL